MVFHFATGAAVFLLIAVPWIAIISVRHGSFTIGTAGSVIFSSRGPGADLPILTAGLLPPPREEALSVWDDPAVMPNVAWSPFTDRASFVHFLRITAGNAGDLLQELLGFSVLSIVIFLGAFLLLLHPTSPTQRRTIALLLLPAVLLSTEYLPILIDPRYLWLAAIIAAVLGGMQLYALQASGWLTSGRRMLLFAAFTLSFVVAPAIRLVDKRFEGRTFARQSAALLIEHPNLQGARIAADVWKAGLFLSYHIHARYFGTPKGEATADIERELLASDIAAYIVWGDPPVGLRQYEEVGSSERRPFRFYMKKSR